MANIDLLDIANRKLVIDEIVGNENITRKRNEQRKFDVYRERQDRYVIEKLESELSPKTVERMRKILSINVCKRIIDQKASIYRHAPERFFVNASEKEKEQLENLYRLGDVNSQMRLSNAYFELSKQNILYVVPKNGRIIARPIPLHMIDVIPDVDDPEKAYAYILNVWDLDFRSSYQGYGDNQERNNYYANDKSNQTIADDSDRSGQQGKFIIWTKDYQVTCNERGELLSDVIENPIGELPFVDIAIEKDFQFFVRRGAGVVDFTIELLADLSDLATISKLQGYSQAVVYSTEEPKDLIIGAQKVLWFKKDPTGQGSDPKFEFSSPSPDLGGSLEIINTRLKMFLSSEGLDPSTVSGRDPARQFNSGIDHLLANLDKFEASQQTMDLYRTVEENVFSLMVKWSNFMQPFNDEKALDPRIRLGQISDKVYLDVKYHTPMSVQTKQEIVDEQIKLIEMGLTTKVKALMKIYGVSEDEAESILGEINEETESLVIGSQPDNRPE